MSGHRFPAAGPACFFRDLSPNGRGRSRERDLDFTTRSFARASKRTIAFSEIARLDYSFDETAIDPGSAWWGSQDSTEWFTLGIVLKKDREEVAVGRFIGEGSVDHGWVGILAGDDALDYRGDQEERSLGLVKLLQAMTGLPLT